MPTQQEQDAAAALAVAQLRARIEERRHGGWLPTPGDTAQTRRQHWQELAEQTKRKIEAGEYVGDELLAQLRDDRTMNNLGRVFLQAAERGNAAVVGAFIEEGFPVNFQEPLTGETALHACAATRGRGVLRILVACGLCNFLLRDKGGRLASELAYLFGKDPAAARLLGIKESKQAVDRGITLTRRPKP
jgi:hypothetical protein